jgi:hypothetical protein
MQFLQLSEAQLCRWRVADFGVRVGEISDRLRLLRIQAQRFLQGVNSFRVVRSMHMRNAESVMTVEERGIGSDYTAQSLNGDLGLSRQVVHLPETGLDERRQRIELVRKKCLSDAGFVFAPQDQIPAVP